MDLDLKVCKGDGNEVCVNRSPYFARLAVLNRGQIKLL